MTVLNTILNTIASIYHMTLFSNTFLCDVKNLYVENTQVSNYPLNVLDDITQGFNNMNVMMHLDTCGAPRPFDLNFYELNDAPLSDTF